MSNGNDTFVIRNALSYSDNLNKNMRELNNSVKAIETLDTVYDQQKNIMIFKNEKDEEILRTEYECVGMFFSETKTWVWSWNLGHLTKNKYTLCRGILNYGLDLGPEKESRDLKIHLTTSRFSIIDPVQIDIFVALASYLSKKYIYKQIDGLFTKYYFLTGLNPQQKIQLNESSDSKLGRELSNKSETIETTIHSFIKKNMNKTQEKNKDSNKETNKLNREKKKKHKKKKKSEDSISDSNSE